MACGDREINRRREDGRTREELKDPYRNHDDLLAAPAKAGGRSAARADTDK
jgi:hypothetical protein